jgi:hypothetical protein
MSVQVMRGAAQFIQTRGVFITLGCPTYGGSPPERWKEIKSWLPLLGPEV